MFGDVVPLQEMTDEFMFSIPDGKMIPVWVDDFILNSLWDGRTFGMLNVITITTVSKVLWIEIDTSLPVQ